MAERVAVTEPRTGVELSVLADSPQAKLWGKSEPKRPARKAAATKSDDEK